MPSQELNFFVVDDKFYGGNQNWNRHYLMRLGGCSTTTACESCICLARDHPVMRRLYPYDPQRICIDDFRNFSEHVFPYVHPGIGGLTDVNRYASMVLDYTASCGVTCACSTLRGTASLDEAERYIRGAIDRGLPVSFLLLRHQDAAFDDFEWHWFTITGYERMENTFIVIAATYGRRYLLDLRRMWNTGYRWRGGMAVLQPTP